MSSMDFRIGIEDVGVAVLQELWNRVALQTVELAKETRDVVLEKDSFREFSRCISELGKLLQALNVRKIEATMGSDFTKAALEKLNSQLMKARKIIVDYKSGSRIRLLLHSHSVLSRMQALAKDIAATISSFQLINLDMAVNLKSMNDQIINNLNSIEFRMAAATETIASEIENSIFHSNRNRENAMKLLEKIAEAVGANVNASLVKHELALLKQEKEAMEVQKKQAEALQLSQLIQLLYSTEIVSRPQNEETSTYHKHYPIGSFICPLCEEMMVDPVAVFCGHSFERRAIQEYFKSGKKNCPTCREELQSLELTPNVNLRSSIEEWKRRDMDWKFQAAVPGINCNDHLSKNKALDDLKALLEIPEYAVKAAKEGLIPKFVESLKDARLNSVAAEKCLYCIAKFCDEQKQEIVQAGAVRRIVKRIYNGETEPGTIAILLELSKTETLIEKIGNTKDCIPLLVSLLSNPNPDISWKAQNVLQNLSSNIHFVVKMAEAGYFQSFVTQFNQGHQETRALMAAALVKMQLKENSINDLKDKQFVHNLVHMLSSNSPACKSACIKCVKKLAQYPKMVKRFLSDPATIPLLLNLISFRSDPLLKQEAAEILALLIEACQPPQFEMYQGLQELQSEHNVSLFLRLVANFDPQFKIQFLHLLIELSNKSKRTQNLIRSNRDAVNHLFSCLDSDRPSVRRWTMKLIHCVSEGHPDGVPLPPSPGKETAINTLSSILTCSPDFEERSIAAGIISQLPKDDIEIDEILRKSETVKAIHEVICSSDEEFGGIGAPTNQDKSLLENALAALLRFTEPSKPELQRQVGQLELYPSLVRVLSIGSPLAKQRTAIALAQLSQSTSLSVSHASIRVKQENSMPLLNMMKLFPNMSWCCSDSADNEISCPIHGVACLQRHTFCLVKADAVKPLLRTLSDTNSGVAEAALMALETLLEDHNTLSHATAAIVESQGVVAFLQVLEKGSLSAKTKALDLFQKILNHSQISDALFQRSEGILIQLLHDETLRKKVALVLKQMNVLPEQSSYF
ncbi:U-box domain-containing protein 44-like [Durio zibethinus]|uniref:RING-type E3 ubiquitin transferase n=1 Tax=Durio zibethinus TaxID=66656 RepID=A0A6P6AGX8_DURZI|nr:U-box domain-containing protein 44-like [Durio zibethinus]XP_022764129.1 U-box domain-containing protein 44-like [Durio zibethinus]XP_022764130.1 U-box domain-containing protein 44-like [Durio zibethinus]